MLDASGLDPASSRRSGRPGRWSAGCGRPSPRGSGCPTGLPVVLGGADSQACALGAGVVGARAGQRDGRARRPASTPWSRLPLAGPGGHPLPARHPGPFTTETGINTTGAGRRLGGRSRLRRAGRAAGPRRLRPAGRRGAAPSRRAPTAWSPCPSWATASGPTRTFAARSPACPCATGGRSWPGPMLEGVAFAIGDQLDLLRRAAARRRRAAGLRRRRPPRVVEPDQGGRHRDPGRARSRATPRSPEWRCSPGIGAGHLP